MIVELTKGLKTTIDDRDVWILEGNKWVASGNTDKERFYAVRGKGKTRVSLHRVLLDAPKGMQVDHIDGDTLNNRRNNLRLCTSQQNTFNSKKKTSASKYKGVWYNKRLKKWTSRLMINGKNLYFGLFDTEEGAGIAYNEGAREHFGEFARLNKIDD